MNLLYTLTSYPPVVGGAQLLQHQIAVHLKDRHRIQVVTHWDQNRSDWLLGTSLLAPNKARDYEVDGVSVHRLGLGWKERLSLLPILPIYYPLMDIAVPLLSRHLERSLSTYAAQADLVHHVRIGREPLAYASRQAARRHDIPFVLTPVHHPRWNGWRYRVYLELYRQADAVLALTEAERETLASFGVREERIEVIGMGPVVAVEADPQRFLRKHSLDGPVVLFLAQHYPYKGYRELLQAAPLVWKRVADAYFVFIGPPVGRSESSFRSPDRRIRRLGAVDLQEKTDALAACDLLCVPSTQESFGGVYLEAWSFAKPVIGCNIPAVAEVITDGEDGLLVTQEAARIADRILDLLLDPSRAQAMGRAGRRKLEARYTWENISRRTELAYLKALGTR